MDRAGKATKPSKRSFREDAKMKMQQAVDSPPMTSNLTSPIITMVVGSSQRLFACHQDILSMSPFFATALRGQFFESFARRIELPDEVPEVFSSVLEYLYKGDYYPRLLHDKKRNTFALEDAAPENPGRGSIEATIYHPGVDGILLKDTAMYCTAEKFGLEDLKRLALRKQGLQTGISVDVILRSARYAYANTPDQDAKLRAHFLALIIRSRKTFKRSGTMQMEMETGGSKLFFDLFVAMCNHIDDVVELTSKSSPRTI
jgi:hypothetical protein